MLTATILALTAAVLHAGWNLAVKRSIVDRFHTVWGQVLVGAAVGLAAFTALGGMDAAAWKWAALSGVIHVPYTVLLARAYDTGDFSQVYPLARGAGALVAGIGGIVLLGDRITAGAALAVAVVVGGLFLLVGRAPGPAVVAALGVAVSIGCYTLADSQGSRVSGVAYYGLATAAMSAVAVSVYGVAVGRHHGLMAAARRGWPTMVGGGLAQMIAYTLVLAAVRLAPVGYVTALRETSVVIAVLLGWRLLGEREGGRRLAASGTVLAGVVLLITAS